MFEFSFGARSSTVDPLRSLKNSDNALGPVSGEVSHVESWLDSVAMSRSSAGRRVEQSKRLSINLEENFPEFVYGSEREYWAFPFPPFNWPVPQPELEARPMDGVGTNEDSPELGSAGTYLSRLAPDSFTDGGETLAGADRPNAREISNIVMRQDSEMPNSAGASDFLWIWGQFLDHDIGLTEPGHTEAANIAVPIGDPQFDPFGTGVMNIGFNRVDDADPEVAGRQYENALTAFIDGSQIYGSSDEEAALLRIEGGKILLSSDGYLVEDGSSLLTGDIRAAENIALTSMHTLFAREHNRLAEELASENPDMDDDTIFTEARARVEAIMQAITFNEFLPLLLGEDAIGAYSGYDASVDPGLSIEFTGAVFRLGHTLLSPELQRIDEDGQTISAGHIALRDAFFAPDEITDNGGIDPILRGGAGGTSQELDATIVEDVRSFLFGPPGAGGFDLAALNIQRGRDLGLPSYNDLREALGLGRVTSFSEITSDTELAAAFEEAYGDVDLVDLWVGGLAEDPVEGAMLGETFSVVLIDQFTRLRDGDAFWSEGRDGFSDSDVEDLWATTLSDVIVRNTDIDHMQRDAFIAHDRIGGTGEADELQGTDAHDLIIGFGGDDLLSGGFGDDDLFGGDGEDVLIGEAGNNILTGGADADTFVFDAAVSGHDIVTDYSAEDTVQISNLNWLEFDVEIEADEYTVRLSDERSITFEAITDFDAIIEDLFPFEH